MKTTVIGSGRWGSFIAWYLRRQGREVLIYGRADSERFADLKRNRCNEYVKYDDGVRFTSDLRTAVDFGEEIFISISAQSFRDFMRDMALCGLNRKKTLILCMKGLEERTGERLTQIVDSTVRRPVPTAIWVGPGHVQDFINNKANCMVIDSADSDLTARLTEELGSELIRFYKGADLVGNEVGAAAKNVIGIAAGILDGLELTALKGALMSRGAREIGRLIESMGGKEITAYGLAHLGDYEATLFSHYSHNRMYGECLATGKSYHSLAEGRSTCKALMVLSAQYGVELPICNALYEVVFNGYTAQNAIEDLFLRDIKKEF